MKVQIAIDTEISAVSLPDQFV